MTLVANLDIRVTLNTKGITKDAYGEPNHEELTEFAKVWAERVRFTEGERHFAGADFPATTVIFRIRYRTDVTEKTVLLYDGWEYDVERIEPSGFRRREWLLLLTTKQKEVAE